MITAPKALPATLPPTMARAIARLDAGMDDYLSKPLVPLALERVLARHARA